MHEGMLIVDEDSKNEDTAVHKADSSYPNGVRFHAGTPSLFHALGHLLFSTSKEPFLDLHLPRVPYR